MKSPVKPTVRFVARRKRLALGTLILCLAGGLVAWQWYRFRQAKDDEAAESLLADLAVDSERINNVKNSLPAEDDLSKHANYDEQYRELRIAMRLTIERVEEFKERSEAIRWAHSKKRAELTHRMLDYGLRANFAMEAFDDRLRLLTAIIEMQSRDELARKQVLLRFQINPTKKPAETPYFEVTLALSVTKLRSDQPKNFDAYWTGKRARLIGEVTRVQHVGEKWSVYLDGMEYKDVRMVFEPDQVVSEGGTPVTRGTSVCIEGSYAGPDGYVIEFAGCRLIERHRSWSEGLDAAEWWRTELKAGRRPDTSPQGRASNSK